MAKAMNRSVANVVFGAFGQVQAGVGSSGDGRNRARDDARRRRPDAAFARKVIVVPGYGMAVAQAQHDVRQLATTGGARHRRTYAIHPVAGRMPGHMNVLLARRTCHTTS